MNGSSCVCFTYLLMAYDLVYDTGDASVIADLKSDISEVLLRERSMTVLLLHACIFHPLYNVGWSQEGSSKGKNTPLIWHSLYFHS